MVSEKKEDKNTQPTTEAKVDEKAPKNEKKDKTDKKEQEEELVIY